MFILGFNENRFLFNYHESNKDRILGDLRDKVVVLTKEDIAKIPNNRWYIDIYLLLLEHRHIQIDYNVGLYKKAIQYLSDFWFLNNNEMMLPFSFLAKKIHEILITSSSQNLLTFYRTLPSIMNMVSFQEPVLLQRIISLSKYLSILEETQAARELSWVPFRTSLLEEYTTKLGKAHHLTTYFRDIYMPFFQELYKIEKQTQKAIMDTCKEELIAYTWHPDRFELWCLDEEEKKENRELFA